MNNILFCISNLKNTRPWFARHQMLLFVSIQMLLFVLIQNAVICPNSNAAICPNSNAVQRAAWTTQATASQFGYDDCIETRSWEDIARTMKASSLITVGSLSGQYWPEYESWACFQEHKCLSLVTHSPGDAMCYVYDEVKKKWLPWGLDSEVLQCSADNSGLASLWFRF